MFSSNILFDRAKAGAEYLVHENNLFCATDCAIYAEHELVEARNALVAAMTKYKFMCNDDLIDYIDEMAEMIEDARSHVVTAFNL